ncbi:unnamed protein product, partial [Cuscuta epithymum]
MAFASGSQTSSRSKSTGSPSSVARTTLNYDPPFYCWCGLKAPLCVARESGRKFLGCQKWLDGGCKYFVWYDEMKLSTEEQKTIDSPLKTVKFADMNGHLQHIKDTICEVRQESQGSHAEIARVKNLLENHVKEEQLK